MEVYQITFKPAGTAAVVGLLLAIFYYMLGRIVGGALEQKGREYLNLAVGNFIVLASLPLLIYILSEAAGVLSGHGGFDQYLGAKLAILRVESSLRAIYYNLFTYHILLSLLTGFNIGTVVEISGAMIGATSSIGINPFGGLDVILEKLDSVLTQLIIVYGMLAGRAVLLELGPALFIALLPLGILMRGIPWTKKTGSSIISLVISLYLVFPLSVLMSDYILFGNGYRITTSEFMPTADFMMVDDIGEESVDIFTKTIQKAESTTIEGEMKRSPMQVVGTFLKNLFTLEHLADVTFVTIGGILSTFPGWPRFLGLALAGIGGAPILSWFSEGIHSVITLSLLLSFSLAYSSAVLMVGVFLSLLLEIAITVSAFRALGQVLGGETALLGLARLV